MVSRISNEGTVDVPLAPIDIPPRVSEVTLSDGTSIALHGVKWDGYDCELLDVALPPPFCAHLFKSPVFFTGTFTCLTAALADLTRRASCAAPKAAVVTPNFPVNTHTDPDSNGDKNDLSVHEYDQNNDAEDEDLVEIEHHMSCDDECTGNSSNDEDCDEAHADDVAPNDFEFT